MQNNNTITLQDIAKATKVSVATVSNAFNRPDQLSITLKNKIIKAANDMGYFSPNLAASIIRNQSSSIIGVMLLDSLNHALSDGYTMSILRGISSVAYSKGQHILLLSNDSSESERLKIETLLDGAIFYGSVSSKPIEKLLAQRKKVVCIDFTYPSASSVTSNQRKLAADVASLAIGKHTKKIAVLGLRLLEKNTVESMTVKSIDALDNNELCSQRLYGFMDIAAKNGIEISPEQILSVPFNNKQSAAIAASYLLSQEIKPDVVLCMSDVLASAVLEEAKSMKINVPEELQITGIDNIQGAPNNRNTLTTIDQNAEEKGRNAATMIVEDSGEKHLIVPAQLVLGQTTLQ